MHFYLIRHGQTDWNVGRKIQGRTDVPLNDFGREQADLAGKAMRDIPIDKIYTSDLSRASDTAEAVRRNHSGAPIPMVKLREFEEVEFGAWEARTLSEVEHRWPEDFAKWKADSTSVTPEGGESPAEVDVRVAEGFRKILTDPALTEDSTVLITAHGAVLVHIVEWLLRNAPSKHEIIVENASISLIDYDTRTGMPTIRFMNDTRHLGAVRGKNLV